MGITMAEVVRQHEVRYVINMLRDAGHMLWWGDLDAVIERHCITCSDSTVAPAAHAIAYADNAMAWDALKRGEDWNHFLVASAAYYFTYSGVIWTIAKGPVLVDTI